MVQAKGDIGLSMSEHTNKHMEQLFLSQVNRPDVKQFAQKNPCHTGSLCLITGVP